MVSFKDISRLAGMRNRENLPLESYSISNESGFVPQNEQFENGGTMSNADKRLYYIVSPDSFAYNPARINVGSIGYDNLDKDVIVSSLYVVFKTDDNTYNPFLNYWFKTSTFKKMIEQYQEGGVRLYFFYDKLCKCSFRRPSMKEQQCIASFFTELDTQISTQQQRLDRLKQMKSACLRSMFPQNGGGYFSAIRFKGFKDEWILMNFSDMVQRVSTYDMSNILPCVEFEDIVAGEGVLNKDIFRKNVCKHGIRFTKNDVLFGKLRPYLKNILFSDFNGIAVGDFWVLRAMDKVDPYFLFLLVSSERFMNIANISSGSKMPRADWNLVSNSKFAIPPSLEEQRRIGSFFRKMDKQISLQTQKVELLKQVKRACLNKMIA